MCGTKNKLVWGFILFILANSLHGRFYQDMAQMTPKHLKYKWTAQIDSCRALLITMDSVVDWFQTSDVFERDTSGCAMTLTMR